MKWETLFPLHSSTIIQKVAVIASGWRTEIYQACVWGRTCHERRNLILGLGLYTVAVAIVPQHRDHARTHDGRLETPQNARAGQRYRVGAEAEKLRRDG